MLLIVHKYKLSQHANERFQQRVGKGNPKAWVNYAIEHGIDLGENAYRYGPYKIIVSEENVVVTISYHNDEQIKDFKQDVVKTLVNKFNRKLEPLAKRKKAMQIAYHEAHIRELKARNPNIKASIREDIKAIEKEISVISTEINDVLKVAIKYHIQKGDLNV